MTQTDPFPDPPGEPEPSSAQIEPEPERRRSAARIWVGVAAVAALLVVAALALTASDDPSSPATAAPADAVSVDGQPRTAPIGQGEPVPRWSAPTLDGGSFDWAERSATPTVLAIWAPWCPHCQAELPRLSAAVEAHPGVSLVTIATATDQPGPTPQEYMASEGLTFTVALDDDRGTLAAGLGVQGFPTTYFVDAQGIVLASAAGELDPDALDEVLAFLEEM